MFVQLGLLTLVPALALAAPSLDKREVTCLDLGATATAEWIDSKGRTCTFTGIVGSNYGSNIFGNGDYSCNGRCGAGCETGLFSKSGHYTQDCFSHDICSYFNNADDGVLDRNCDSILAAALDDYLTGGLHGCKRTNPSNPVTTPSTTPVCV